MMVGMELPFACDPLEPAYADSVPDYPDPMMVLPVVLAAGLVLGLFTAGVGRLWRRPCLM